MKHIEEMLDFLYKSPSCFHAVDEIKKHLKKAGYEQLDESQKWKIHAGGKYFVMRNHSSIIALDLPENPVRGYRIMASHSDSPCFKIKENPEIVVEDKYVKLNVENYGGMIYSSWYDRPLSVAGRIICDDGRGGLTERLVNIDRDLLIIPNLAIHMDREVNTGYKYNPQKDLQPIYGTIASKGRFMEEVAEAADTKTDVILGHDLFLYQRGRGSVLGGSNEFLAAPKLDDLQCAFSSLKGFTAAKEKKHISILCVFDNEETGSGTKQGAASSFLYDTLQRINEAMGRSYEDYLIDLSEGFMVSADNAHGLHPNHQEKADPVNRPVVGGGIVIKFNAAQKYCTDGASAAFFRQICKKAGLKTQNFTNRSDIAGGSTLGNLSNLMVPMKSVDIGLPQLAMHSAWETAGVKDTEDMIVMAEQFFRE